MSEGTPDLPSSYEQDDHSRRGFFLRVAALAGTALAVDACADDDCDPHSPLPPCPTRPDCDPTPPPAPKLPPVSKDIREMVETAMSAVTCPPDTKVGKLVDAELGEKLARETFKLQDRQEFPQVSYLMACGGTPKGGCDDEVDNLIFAAFSRKQNVTTLHTLNREGEDFKPKHKGMVNVTAIYQGEQHPGDLHVLYVPTNSSGDLGYTKYEIFMEGDTGEVTRTTFEPGKEPKRTDKLMDCAEYVRSTISRLLNLADNNGL
jgi:hypothetical protein